jgi:hypothetical protein
VEALKQYEFRRAELPKPAGRRPVLLLSRVDASSVLISLLRLNSRRPFALFRSKFLLARSRECPIPASLTATICEPALLKDAVTLPARCPIDGIWELEEAGLRVSLIKAVMRSTQRTKELAG